LEGDFALRQQPTPFDVPPREITSLRYDLLALDDVYLDFAGRQFEGHEIHQRLSELAPGSQLTASITAKGHIELVNSTAASVARLSTKARDAWIAKIDRICRISVVAIVVRTIEDVDADYASSYRCTKWEVPVVEITWR